MTWRTLSLLLKAFFVFFLLGCPGEKTISSVPLSKEEKGERASSLSFAGKLSLHFPGLVFPWSSHWLGPKKVERVVDGDTLVFEGKEKVRLLGVNAPEKGEPFYRQATLFLEKLLLRKKVFWEVEKRKKDRYGRWLVYLFLPLSSGKYLFVNGALVRRGLAVYFPFGRRLKHGELLSQMEEKAKGEVLGIWKVKEFPWEAKKSKSGRQVSRFFAKKAYEIARRYRVRWSREKLVLFSRLPRGARFGGVVEKVLDGDTVVLKGKGKVRLLGVDTPERGEPFYHQAKEFLKKLLLGKKVFLLYDRKSQDRYGRLLLYLFVPYRSRWLFVNGQLVRSGMAVPYFLSPNFRFKKQFFAWGRKAFLEKRGIWKISDYVKPEKFYLAGPYHFHRPSCPQVRRLKNLKKYRSRKEAILDEKIPARCCHP